MKAEVKTVENTGVADLLIAEQEKTHQLLEEFKKISPKDAWPAHYQYYTPTLLDKVRSYQSGKPAYLFITSLSSLLKGNEKGQINVNLEKDSYGKSNLRIGWPAPLTLEVSIDTKDSATTRLDVRPFSWLPHPGVMSHLFRYGDPLPEELIHQMYSNAVLGLVTEDLTDNHVLWGNELRKKRDENLKNMRELIGEERSWVIDKSLEALTKVAGDEKWSAYVPDIEQYKESVQKPLIYTTASITEDLAKKFSKAVGGGFGRFYPTEYRSSNHPDAKPLIIASIGDLEVEIREIKKDNTAQDQALRSSLFYFMRGDKDALTFSIFPSGNNIGVNVALAAINPQIPAFNS